MKKTRKQINIRLEVELYDFLIDYAEMNYKSVTGVVRDIVADLYKKHMERLAVDENGKVIINK